MITRDIHVEKRGPKPQLVSSTAWFIFGILVFIVVPALLLQR
jgi:hypothetical protein